MMTRFLATIIILGCFLIFMKTYRIWLINQARRNGIYPPLNKATMFDVRRLIIKRERELAVRLYAEIFKTNRKEAQRAVNELERSIREKDFKID